MWKVPRRDFADRTSAVSLPAQHLSDEAIAAFADGFLGAAARSRATRHLATCAECARAVSVQREAAFALRSATAPAASSGLLDRLRSLPSCTPLPPGPTHLGADGTVFFAAYGGPASGPPGPAGAKPMFGSSWVRALSPMSIPARRHTQHVALAATAFALVAAGVVASAPSTTGSVPGGGLAHSGNGTSSRTSNSVPVLPAVHQVDLPGSSAGNPQR